MAAARGSSYRPAVEALRLWIIPVAAAGCVLLRVSSAAALVGGMVIAGTIGNPWHVWTKRLTPQLLALAVVGLGAGINLFQMASAGAAGIAYTLMSVALTFAVGTLLGRWLRTPRTTSLLITAGTAICGGSAIAAVAPAVGAGDEDVSVSLGTVFVLNAVALVVFPWIGHAIALTPPQFGLWSALAIHDTSSVVGATLQYGQDALHIGTTVKLARALWIVPVTMVVSYFRGSSAGCSDAGPKKPWFTLGFILMAALMTCLPALRPVGRQLEALSRRVLVVTLLLIGTNMTRDTIRRVGVRPLSQGFLLWTIVAIATLSTIELGWTESLLSPLE